MTTSRPAVDDRRVGTRVVPVVLDRTLLGPTTAAFAGVAAILLLLDLTGVQVPAVVQVVPFALSVLLFGLPHGALDHLVPARLDARVTVRRSITSVVVLYALLGGATALLWSALPVVGFAAFIAVTWYHWGQGDLWLERARGRTGPSRLDGALTVLVRGGLPMLVPLIAHPHDYAAVLRSMTGLVRPGTTGEGDLLESAPIRLAAAAALAACIAAHLLLRRRRREPLGGAVLEIAVLALFFTTVPPVLAVGLYFTFWHAVRHILRLELLDAEGRAALERGRLLRPFAHFLRDALPVTACAIALLAGLALALRSPGLGTYLLLIAALTTPHTAVVAWMDSRFRMRA